MCYCVRDCCSFAEENLACMRWELKPNLREFEFRTYLQLDGIFLFGLRKLAQVCFIDFPTKKIFHKHFVREIFKFRSCWDFQEVCSCLLHISQFRTVQYGLRINNWTVGGQKHATAQQYWRPGRVCVGGGRFGQLDKTGWSKSVNEEFPTSRSCDPDPSAR